MNCSSYHSEKTSADCPWCIIRMLVRVVERLDANAPELTPAIILLEKAKREQRTWSTP